MAALIWLGGISAPGLALADEVSLVARPASCIALHRGQRCFRQVVLQWRVPAGDERFCIRRVGDDTPVRCWQAEPQGQVSIDYASATEEQYVLTREPDRTELAQAIVETAWVYRGSRRGTTGWRLF